MRAHLATLVLTTIAVATPAAMRAGVTHSISLWEGGANPVINNPAPYSNPDVFTHSGGTIRTVESYAAQGFGQLSMELRVTNVSGSTFADANVAPGWNDTLTIDAPGRTGQAGSFTWRLILNAAGSASNPFVIPFGYPSLDIAYTVGTSGVGSSQWWGGSTSQPTYSNRIIQGTEAFTFGTPISISARIGMRNRETGSSLPNGEVATFVGNASLAWGGIVTVVDSTSAPVSNFTTVSPSGTDYSTAVVPEPGSAMLLTATGTLFATLRRPRRRSF